MTRTRPLLLLAIVTDGRAPCESWKRVRTALVPIATTVTVCAFAASCAIPAIATSLQQKPHNGSQRT